MATQSVEDDQLILTELASQLRNDHRIAVSLGFATEVLFWLPVIGGMVVAGLGAVGSKRLGYQDGAIEPWLAAISAASATIAVVSKQARLRSKTNSWFEFVVEFKPKLLRARAGYLKAVDLLDWYEKARPGLQSNLRSEDEAIEETDARTAAGKPPAAGQPKPRTIPDASLQ